MTDHNEAISRLTAWVREFGGEKQKEFIADVTTVLEAARRCGELEAENEELTTRLQTVCDYVSLAIMGRHSEAIAKLYPYMQQFLASVNGKEQLDKEDKDGDPTIKNCC